MKKKIYKILICVIFTLTFNSLYADFYNGYLKIDSYIGTVKDDGLERKLYAPYKVFNLKNELVRESGYHFDKPHTVELAEGEYKIVYFNSEYIKKEIFCKVENHKTTLCTLN